jgi:prepilin-type N-terminal cleavage/methylation domain-containing protein
VIRKLGEHGGFSLIEMLVVMVIMSVVAGGIVTLFTTGINAETDQNHRFQAQQDGRVALDKLRREVHAGCSISTPSTYNSALSSVTIYSKEAQASPPNPYPSACLSGTHTVTYCTLGSGSHYTLYRKVGTTCAITDQPIADYLTAGPIFIYLPPNSHLTAAVGALGGGTAVANIVTADGSSTLPRLHVDMTLNQRPGKLGGYRLVDDLALRNGPRSCVGAYC